MPSTCIALYTLVQLVQGKKQRHRSQIVWRLWEEMKKDGVSLESTSVDDVSKDAFASDMQTSDTEQCQRHYLIWNQQEDKHPVRKLAAAGEERLQDSSGPWYTKAK